LALAHSLSITLKNYNTLKMVRVFITGSSDGIGLAAAKALCERGHKVTLHARNAQRAEQASKALPEAEGVLVGDLSSISETKKLAEEANKTGTFDAIIQNAGIGYGATSSKEITPDGISAVFAVNTLAPYILTCLMDKPKSRILFMSSDSHFGGDASLKNCTTSTSYGNSKLHDTMLAKAFARRLDIQSVSMHPGWISTKMGGRSAPGTTEQCSEVLADWCEGEGFAPKLKSGAFFTTRGEESSHPGANNVDKQEELMKICRDISGVAVPGEE
jgi:NAD(P)-dependent dehydrogenase (short-subunit alcohol dehydrogenase family)